MHPQIDLTKKLFWSSRDEKYYEAWKAMKEIKASAGGSRYGESLAGEINLRIMKKTNKQNK